MRRTALLVAAVGLLVASFLPGQAVAHDDEYDVCHTYEQRTEEICNQTDLVSPRVSFCPDRVGVVVEHKRLVKDVHVCHTPPDVATCSDGVGVVVDGTEACVGESLAWWCVLWLPATGYVCLPVGAS